MYKDKKILGLVPARGGSKRLLNKNIKPLAGKPLIAWTIEYAKKSKYMDSVFVSSDSKKILDISRNYGVNTPFLRPKELASDKAKTIDVILHVLDCISKNNDNYDILVLLQPTSPLRTGSDIDKAIKFFFKKDARAIISVCKSNHKPSWTNILPKNGNMGEFLDNGILKKNKSEFNNYYSLNGAIYIADCDYLLKRKSFFGKESFAYVMPRKKSIDIDDELDFRLAEFLIRNVDKRGIKINV